MPDLKTLPAGESRLSITQLKSLNALQKNHRLTALERPFVKVRQSTPLQQTFTLTFKDIEQVDNIIAELQASGWIEYAEKVPLNKVSIIPNDYTAGAAVYLDKINAPAAWDLNTGSNAVVAIVDDAVDITHPDLVPNLWVNPGEVPGNGIDDDGNGYIDDVHGVSMMLGTGDPNPLPGGQARHGTQTAGAAGAATNNGIGIASIGYACRLMCISAGTNANIYKGYEGIVYAADNGADIINCSWSSETPTITGQNIINYARERGAVVVGSAGNEGNAIPRYPGAYEGAVAVAAVTSTDRKSDYSSYGPQVTVCAPGDYINVTYIGGQYVQSTGTSFAAPIVSGLLGLMRSLNPLIPVYDLIALLKASAVNIDALNPVYAGKLGAGRINAAAALQLVQATLSYPPAPNFSSNFTTASEGASITFTDRSAYGPTTYAWSFPGGTPSAYLGKTPPSVKYTTAGAHDVTLTVANANGQTTETKSGFIIINPYDPCNSLHYPVPGWDSINHGVGWPAGTFGYTYGINGWAYRQNALYFDVSATPAAYITNVRLGFGLAYSADRTKRVSVHIYDGTTGAPGALLGSSFTTMDKIMNDVNEKQGTILQLPTPVQVPASNRFFVSVDYQQLKWDECCTDKISLYSAQNGLADPSPIWMMDRDGIWRQNGTVDAQPLKSYLYIHPFLTNEPLVPAVQLHGMPYRAPGAAYTVTAVASQAGNSPVYEFYVNSVRKQIGSAHTYTSYSLRLGDLISCKIATGVECAAALSAVSNIVEVGTTGTLPITLAYFKGRPTAEGNVLTWRTLSETNTAGFAIESSPDGIGYLKLATVPAAGESQQPINYNYTDKTPPAATAFYRLRMTDRDGAYTLSPVVRIEKKNATAVSLEVWPQPASAGDPVQLKLTGRAQGRVTLRILRATGQIVSTASVQASNEVLRTTINTQGLPGGLYFIHCLNSAQETIGKTRFVLK